MIFNNILDKIKKFIELIILVETKLGLKKLIKYALTFLTLILILNYESVVITSIEFINDISDDIHSEKMEIRDQYMNDLGPLLAEFRASVDADRVLYFEFHNSESNLDGVPFKFFDLMKCNTTYGSQDILGSQYKNIGAGMYSELFYDINHEEILICNGINDIKFRDKYKGVFELFNKTDNSEMQVFFSVPGIKQPIGFIVIEWMDATKVVNLKKKDIDRFRPRISAIGAARLK